jgi:flagellar hook assembly protein FlgD
MAGQLLSNVYQNGSANVPVIGTVTDTNLNNWLLEPYAGGPAIAQGTSAVNAGTIGVWNTLNFSNISNYSLRLTAWDKAGNSRLISQPQNIGNFLVSQNSVLQIDSVAGGSVTYTSTVPFSLHETILLKNAAGQVVRTLVNADRAAGTYTDAWNGRTSSNGLLPDGVYFYVATAATGQSNMTWDQTGEQLGTGYNQYFRPAPGAWDPFNNSRLIYDYTTGAPGLTSIIFTTTAEDHIYSTCDPTRICPVLRKYEESGAHSFRWSGVDQTGAFRGDEIKRSIAVNEQQYWTKNAVILYGTKPTITNLRVTPAVYGPAVGTQSITLDLTTYQNQSASVSVSFLNQSSLSTLRTVTAANQVPGPVTIPWDGRADNGMWIAPGFYTITVAVTDPIGNVVSEQLLTTIQY